ncbi:MAG: PQQ-binding-like beta-propeller repeat protein [Fuerstiella sp.]|nr:PQQ-binding-like beta-propeller repeat protein [Fuerstiella sp.]
MQSIRIRVLCSCLGIASGIMLVSDDRLCAEDWNQFRGPNRDNLSSETGLLDRWPDGGPERLWTATGLGKGYASVAVVGDLVYSMGNVDDGEDIIALDRNTGAIVWKTRNGDEYHDGTGDGPRGTPTVVNGKVYALGGNGDLTCCDSGTGEVVWQKNILNAFGGSNITWGISESVLVDDGKVVCSPGGSRASVVALDADDGSTKWVSRIPESPQASYASPVIARVGRVKQYVVFTSKGIVGVRAGDGQPMWGQNKSSNGTANCATPLVVGNRIFSSSGYGTGAELVELRSQGTTTTAQLTYHTRDMKNHHGGMVHLKGFVYGSNEDILACVNLRTGKPTWRERGKKGSVVYADNKIVFRNEGGEVELLAAKSQSYQELGSFSQPDRSRRPAWSHPVIAGGRLYLRDQDKLLVYNLQK